MWKPGLEMVQEHWLHDLWGSVQDENVRPHSKRIQDFQDGDHRTLNHVGLFLNVMFCVVTQDSHSM